MPRAILINATTADDYTAAATLRLLGAVRMLVQTANAGVLYQLDESQNGAGHWTEERFLQPVVASLDRECSGVRFRSAASGAPAVVSCELLDAVDVAKGADAVAVQGYAITAAGEVSPLPGSTMVDCARLSVAAPPLSIPHNTNTVVGLKEAYDFNTSGDIWGPRSGAGSGMGVLRDGLYRLTGWAAFAVGAGNKRRLFFAVSGGAAARGSVQMAPSPAAGDFSEIEASTVVSLTVGGYIEMFVVQDSGAPLNLTDAFLEMTYLHP